MAHLDIFADAPHIQINRTNAHDDSGSGVFATRPFSLGDTLAAVSAPMVVALDKDRLLDTCYQCFRQAGDVPYEMHLGFPLDGNDEGEVDGVKLNRCAGCKVVRYCGKMCQKTSWAAHHSLECPVFKKVYPDILPNHIRAILRLLLLKDAGRVKQDDWKSLMGCVSHSEKFESLGQRAELAKLRSMAKMARNFMSGRFEEGEILSLLFRLKINSITLQTPFHDPLGLALHPLLAKVNHSCNPNSYIRFPAATPPTSTKSLPRPDQSPIIILTPLRPIATNEEITISYVDEILPTHHRLSDLQHRYFFTCQCNKCTTEQQQHDADTSPQQRTTTHAIQDTIRSQLEQLPETAADTNTSSSSSPSESPTQRIHTLFRQLHGPQDTIPQPGPRAWPWPWEWQRYPLPQLLNRLILAHLDEQRYSAALRLACARHFVVSPRVYAAATHPVRLTHMFVLVRLMGLMVDDGGQNGMNRLSINNSGGGKGLLLMEGRGSDDNDNDETETQTETDARADITRNVVDLVYWWPRLIAEFLGHASQTWKARGERWGEMNGVVQRSLGLGGDGGAWSEKEDGRRKEKMEEWCRGVLDGLLDR